MLIINQANFQSASKKVTKKQTKYDNLIKICPRTLHVDKNKNSIGKMYSKMSKVKWSFFLRLMGQKPFLMKYFWLDIRKIS